MNTDAAEGSDAAADRDDDPVLRRRAQVARWSAAAKRGGYAAVLAAMVTFVVGFVTEFGPVITALVVGFLAVSAVLLIPALIFGYGVKAAEQEDAGQPFRY